MDESDKEWALGLVKKLHHESCDFLIDLHAKHNDKPNMTEVENIMHELHSSIHLAFNRLKYGRDTVWEEELN